MRYIGNKEKLLEWIDYEIRKVYTPRGIFFDFFSGTSNVGQYFKKQGLDIVSSDLLYSSFVLQKALIENNQELNFFNLPIINNKLNENIFYDDRPIDVVVGYLNNLKGLDGFIYKNYTPEGTRKLDVPRMYFSNSNGKKIDVIRNTIEEWYSNSFLLESEYYVLLASLIQSIPFYANISGVYAAFRKKWDPRALKDFNLRKFKYCINDNSSSYAFNVNSLELLEEYQYDIIYLDPPYNERQYAPNYHILETIAKNDFPIIKGITGMRDYSSQKSSFCNKIKGITDLKVILDSLNYNVLVLSYSEDGIMDKQEIVELMELYGELTISEYSHTRFKSNKNGNNKSVKELLFILVR